MHFRISSSLSFQRKTKHHVFLLLFVLTPVHLNWPSYATGKCYRSPRQLISTMKHRWLNIAIHSLTLFKWKVCNLRLNLIFISFFVQYIMCLHAKRMVYTILNERTILDIAYFRFVDLYKWTFFHLQTCLFHKWRFHTLWHKNVWFFMKKRQTDLVKR